MNTLITFLNTTGKTFVDSSTPMLIQSSVLIIALLVLDLLLRKNVRAVFRYCIWMLVLVKLVLPTTLSSPTGVGYWFGGKISGIASEKSVAIEQASPILSHTELLSETVPPENAITVLPLASTAHESIASIPAESVVTASPVTASLSWQGFAFLGWLAVMVAMVLLLVQRMFFVRSLLRQSKDPNASMVNLFNHCKKQMSVGRHASLKLSPIAVSPSVCGLLRPTVLIPQNLPDKLKNEDLKSIFLHELAHIKRGDLWVSLLQTILQIVYFYNPLLWVANAIIRKVREQAVDEMVLVAMGEQAEHYPETLLNISRLTFNRPALSLRLIGVVESKKALSDRIKHIISRPFPKTAKLGYLGLIAIIIIASILLPMAKAEKQLITNTSTFLDSDKDGLSDFQEIHKYLTDPTKKDSDGDGISDDDWNERREYTYSIRSVLRFMPPLDKAALNDDFQDGRVLQEKDDYIEVEVIHYPLSTAEKAVSANPNWQSDYAQMTEYTKPGITTNWDDKMRDDLLAELKADGIAIDKLTDKQVVEQVSSWLLKKSKSLDKVFTTYYIHCPDGKPSVYPDLEDAFEREFNRDKDNYNWTIDQHLEHEVLGKGMFYNKTHGSCTSTATYLTTVLRALGIPTRIIIASPLVDASNRKQLSLVKDGVSHNQIREDLLTALRRSNQGFTNHTFNEVYVGNRWQRLDYKKLGPNRKRPFGLPTHLYTFNDLGEANLAATWGLRYGKGQKDDIFGHDNPYSAIAVSDLFGKHGNIPNPPATKQHKSHSPLPNIYIMHPSGLMDWWEGFVEIVKDVTWNKTGRNHEKKFYDDIFIDGIWDRKAGDIIVLLFSLDTPERIPSEYEDLLPMPWQQIEADLKQGKTVEIKGKGRGLNVILLAAQTSDKLGLIIQNSKFLKAIEATSHTAATVKQPTSLITFEITKRAFIEGDSIEIAEISGTSDIIESGHTYTIKGKYKLSSRDEARLIFLSTNGTTGCDQGPPTKRGAGEFTRTFRYIEGNKGSWLQLSFSPTEEHNDSFGDLYFVQKDSETSTIGKIKQPYKSSGTAVTVSKIQKMDFDGDDIIQIEANSEAGFNFPFYLFIPKTIDENQKVRLFVETNNTGTTSDDLEFHQEKALRLVSKNYPNRIARSLGSPLLVPTFPRPRTNWQAYTHALDRDTLEIDEGKLNRIDLQLTAMIKFAQELLRTNGFKIDNQIFVHGFSASAKFCNRYSYLHPEMVKAVASGGVNGLPTLPVSKWTGYELPFPIGLAGIEEFIGKPFNEKAFRKVAHYIYMGAFDRNDTLPSRDAWSEEEADIIKKALAEKMMPERWQLSQQIYKDQNINAQLVTYNGISHSIKNEMLDDVVKFFKANSGDKYVPIEPHKYPFVEYKQIKHAHIKGLYWSDDERLPEKDRKNPYKRTFLIDIEEWNESQDHRQLVEFKTNAGFRFVLKAEGQKDIEINEKNYSGTRSSHGQGKNLHAFYVKLKDSQFEQIVSDVSYKLEPLNKSNEYFWTLNESVTLTKAGSSDTLKILNSTIVPGTIRTDGNIRGLIELLEHATSKVKLPGKMKKVEFILKVKDEELRQIPKIKFSAEGLSVTEVLWLACNRASLEYKIKGNIVYIDKKR